MTDPHLTLNLITLAVLILLAGLLAAAHIAARNYESDRDRDLDDDWLDWWGHE